MCIRDSGKLILPVDSKEANAFADYTEVKDTEGEAVDPGFLGLDIGPKSIAKFDEALTGAKTVVWNGPMGVFENPDFQAGTIGVMDAIVKQPGVKSIIGGGDSAAAAINPVSYTHLLTVNQYEREFPTVSGSSERVEYAIKMPGNHKDCLLYTSRCV